MTKNHNATQGNLQPTDRSRLFKPAQPLKSISTSELSGKAGKIANVIESRLIAGDYRFGEKLSIYALAEQFEASRQPVAAAVTYLSGIGYLEIIPQVGCRVVSPSAEEVLDFYRMYSKVEAVIAGLAAERHRGDEAEQLIALGQSIAASPFFTQEDRRRYGDSVTEFHKIYGRMAYSPNMLRRIAGLRRISRFYLWQGKSVNTPDPVTTERINVTRNQLAAAIAARDVAQAERLAEEHIAIYPGWVGII